MLLKDGVVRLVGVLIVAICVLIGVAFLTLLERKILGYVQIRKGPNKVGYWGIPQPFADAIKLFTKEQAYPTFSNYFAYYLSPVFSLFLSLIIWALLPYLTNLINFRLGALFFLACTSLGVYTVIVAGWASNSNYALLGGLRAVAQTISYEVRLALILLRFILLVGGFNLINLGVNQEIVWFIFIIYPLSLAWLASMLAETNRTPFDFAEGESELVSGFNVEYRRGGFALIFISEYARILFIRLIFSLLFLGPLNFGFVLFLKLGILAFIFVWVRGTLPRARYDKLIYLAWKVYLPVSLNYLLFVAGVMMYLGVVF